jgi:hypothetical protein
MKENNGKRMVENLAKLFFRGQPKDMEAERGGKVSFETLLDRSSSHCIGEYLWVRSV